MGITGTVPEPRQLSNFGASSNRYADDCPLLGVKRTSDGLSEMSAYDPKRTFPVLITWGPYVTRWSSLSVLGFN
jgi:hypothetical protein